MVTRIGSDEVLKGDTFGGIVVAAVKADDAIRAALVEMGVKDSKTLSEHRIKLLSEKIKATGKVYFVSLFPKEYNVEVRALGLTGLLNKLHAKCIKTLSMGTEEVIVDAYPGASVPKAKLETKAESKYVEVAAASIVARAEALKQIKELSIRIGYDLPLGSTHVIDTLIRMRDEKRNFEEYAKTGFRNVKELQSFGAKQ